ncbi:hypothetical protein D3C71_1112000 [compost metagenome]
MNEHLRPGIEDILAPFECAHRTAGDNFLLRGHFRRRNCSLRLDHRRGQFVELVKEVRRRGRRGWRIIELVEEVGLLRCWRSVGGRKDGLRGLIQRGSHEAWRALRLCVGTGRQAGPGAAGLLDGGVIVIRQDSRQRAVAAQQFHGRDVLALGPEVGQVQRLGHVVPGALQELITARGAGLVGFPVRLRKVVQLARVVGQRFNLAAAERGVVAVRIGAFGRADRIQEAADTLVLGVAGEFFDGRHFTVPGSWPPRPGRTSHQNLRPCPDSRAARWPHAR